MKFEGYLGSVSLPCGSWPLKSWGGCSGVLFVRVWVCLYTFYLCVSASWLSWASVSFVYSVCYVDFLCWFFQTCFYVCVGVLPFIRSVSRSAVLYVVSLPALLECVNSVIQTCWSGIWIGFNPVVSAEQRRALRSVFHVNAEWCYQAPRMSDASMHGESRAAVSSASRAWCLTSS